MSHYINIHQSDKKNLSHQLNISWSCFVLKFLFASPKKWNSFGVGNAATQSVCTVVVTSLTFCRQKRKAQDEEWQIKLFWACWFFCAPSRSTRARNGHKWNGIQRYAHAHGEAHHNRTSSGGNYAEKEGRQQEEDVFWVQKEQNWGHCSASTKYEPKSKHIIWCSLRLLILKNTTSFQRRNKGRNCVTTVIFTLVKECFTR